jgi:hypothetical protein
MKRMFAITTLILVAAVLGSFQLSVKAEDVAMVYDASQASFAETTPAIPGYSASYLATAEMATGTAMASTYGFAETAPAIPGYSASYLATAEMATGTAMAKPVYAAEGSFAATAPQIPGYNAWSASEAPGKALAKPASVFISTDGFALTIPSIPGYNAPYPSLSRAVVP